MRAETVDIKSVRAYWDRRPCNVRHGTAPVGSKEWSEQVSARKYFVEPHIPGFAQFERWRDKRVLEIGCGIGTDTLEFMRHGASIDAVDLSSESLVLARLRCRERLGIGVMFFHMNGEQELPAAGGEGYDLVYSFGVLHHTPHPFRVLRLAQKRLRLGGELRIMLYARWSLKNLLGWQPEAQAGCPLARRYTESQARALVSKAGFEVVSVAQAHIFPYRLKEYVEHRYVKRWPYRVMPASVFRKLEGRLGDHLLIVARKHASNA